MSWFSSIRWAMADQGQGLQRPPRRVLFLGHSFVSRFQRHCDTRLIYNVGLDPQLVSFVAKARICPLRGMLYMMMIRHHV